MAVKMKLLLLIVLLLMQTSVNGQSVDEGVIEVNILVDVSGSMQQNDPDNERIAAARLIINLLPEGARAGIWLFAGDTQVATKTLAVDKAWKTKALAAAHKIHSRGLLTDIEKAIQAVLRDGFGNGRRKSIILLTDGRVDISSDIMVSADSRERILSEWIPVLQQRRIKVNTIALSDNADKALLDRLAFDTEGWAETPDSAEQLQKAFLKMFNKAAPRDTVPLRNNTFTIDEHVEEFSALVFKNGGANATKLIAPSGLVLSQAKSLNAAWVHDSHYDLVTVQQPETGVWKIDADIDPDNQVMVVTDLKLQVDDLPAHIAEKEALTVKARLTEQGETIRRDDFLQLVEMRLQQQDGLGRNSEWHMSRGAAGFFSQTLVETLEKGRHRLKIQVDGKSFQREFIADIDVSESLFELAQSFDREQNTIVLEFTPKLDLIDPDALAIQAQIHAATEEPETVVLEAERGRWLLRVARPAAGEKTIVNFSVMAKTLRGAPITPKIKAIIIDDQFLRKLLEPEAGDPQERVAEEDQKAEATIGDNGSGVSDSEGRDDEQDETDTGEKAGQEQSWGLVIGSVVAVNALLIAAGFFGYRWWKRRSATKQEQLLERMK